MVPELAAGISSGAACASARQNHVGDALRCFDVARSHRGRRLSADHQPAGRNHLEWPHHARRVRNIFAHQTAKDIGCGRNRYRIIGVHRTLHLRIGAGEIDAGAIAVNGHGRHDLDRAGS